jgi:lysophospholipase L1-like esterase
LPFQATPGILNELINWRNPAMKIKPHSKLLMIGDSVTDCGRARPVGEGLFGAVGTGYVALVDGLLSSTYPAHAIRVVNMGSSGDQVRNLLARWQTEVIDQKPDWVSIMIGINDIWRQFDIPRQPECHVLPAEYEAGLDKLVRITQPKVTGLVLMTPYFIESNPADAMRARMDEYGAIVKKIARRRKVLFVDTQAAFNRVLQQMHSAAIAWDRVHPNHIGHQVLARAFLEAIDFDWTI